MKKPKSQPKEDIETRFAEIAEAYRRQQETLARQNKFLINIMESLPHPFYVIDAGDYTIKMANSSAAPSGVPPGATCFVLTHGRDEPCGGSEHVCPVETIKQTKQSLITEHIHYDTEGNLRNVEVHGHPILDDNGDVVQVIEYTLDITERKRAEEKLLRAKREWELTFDSAPDLIAILDTQHRVLRANREMARRLGVTPKECVGLHCYEVVHGKNHPPVSCPHSQTLNDGLEHVAEVFEERLGGDFLVTATPLLDEKGVMIGTVHVARDITVRKRMENELRKSRDELELTVEERTAELRRSEAYLAEAQRLTHTGSWVRSKTGEMVYMSEELFRIFGFDPQDGIPSRETMSRRVHPDDLDRARANIEKSIREEVDIFDEYRILLPGGTIKHIQVIRHPVLNDAGDVVQLVGTAMDITDRKRVEETLRRLNRELRAISNCNQILLRATDEQSLLEEICRIVCEEAGYRMAWVGYAEHDDARSVRPVAWTGAEEGYLATAGITWADTERGRGPAGTAIRSGKSCYIQDYATDPRFAPWRDSALQRGFRSGIVMPLMDEHAKAFGCLCIYSAERNAFTWEEIWLLEELAADLAFGIVTLRSRAARKRAEQEVALLSFALDKIRETALLIDDRGRFHYVNEEGCRVLGYTRAEILGLGVLDIDPEFPAERWSDHWRSLKAQPSLSFESRHRTRDGHIFPVEVSANYFEYGGRAYHLALARDITERKAAEEALRLASAYNRSLIEASLDPLVTIDPEGRISDANAATEQATGYTREQLAGTDFSNYFTEPEKARSGYRKAFHQGFVRDYELEIRNRNGEITPVLYNASVYRDDTGNVIGVFAAARDIAKQKRAEEARSRLAAIVESSDDAIISKDLDGTITSWNEGAERLYGYSAAEVLGRPVSILTLPNQQDEISVFMRRMGEGIRIEHYETQRVKKDGQTINVSLTLSPVKNHRGEIIGVSAIARDISAQKRAEEAVREERQRLFDVLETLPIMICLLKPDYKIAFVNRSFRDKYGQAIGRLCYECRFGNTEPCGFCETTKVFETGLPHHWEFTGSDGSIIDAYDIPFTDVDGSPMILEMHIDITERRRAEEERVSHLKFLECMDRINQAMQGMNDLDQMISNVLDAMLSIFDSDRAFLDCPCDPDAASFEVVIERTRPEYPRPTGVIPTFPDTARNFRLYLASSGPVTLGPGCDYPLEVSHYAQKSQILIALYPKTGKPWLLGMHQCSYPRVWTHDEKKLLNEIARRMTDALTSLLAHRDLHESEERYRVILRTALDGFFRIDMQGRILEVNETYCRMSGYSEQELLTMNAANISAVRTAAEIIAADIRRFAEEGPQRFESVHRRKDGSLFDVEIGAQYQPIASGQAVVFVRDITERKRAEESLRQSEAYLAEAQGLSHTGNWALDVASGKYDYCSEETFRIYEFDPQEGLPTKEAIYRRIHPEDCNRTEESFQKSIREKVDTLDEFRSVLPSGTVKHIQVIRHPVLNSAGEIIRLVGTSMDVTERKLAEEALRASEHKYRELVENANSIILRWNSRGDITFLNEFGQKFFGYQEDEILGRNVVGTITPEIESTGRDLRPLMAKIYENPTVFEQNINENMLRDGSRVWIAWTNKTAFDAEGKLTEVLSIGSDITERKCAEEALRRSEAYLAEAQRLSHTGSWALDVASGEYDYLSEELFRIFGSDPQEGPATWEAALEGVHPEDLDRVKECIEKSIREKVDTFEEYRIVLPDGMVKHLYTVRHPVLNEAGDVVKMVGTTMDITERKLAEEALQNLLADLESRVEERTKELSEANQSLQAANKELDSFSYSVSHDLRAPLRAIDGFSMMVLKGYADKLDDEGKRKLNVIRSNTQQMGRLIDDLLTFSRMGRKEMANASLDMEALVGSAWRELTQLNPERRIQFSVQRLPHGMGDRTLVKEVVINLLSNAIKFTKHRENAIVEVGACAEKETDVYFVKDNGVGFDMQYYDKLFGVFQRLHGADEFEGTGVGLAIVERIIGRHGGRVWAEGKEGEGATFYFTLAGKGDG